MTTAHKAAFQAYSLDLVGMDDCSTVQRCPDVPRLLRDFAARAAVRFRQRCSILDLVCCEKRPSRVVTDHHLVLDLLLGRPQSFGSKDGPRLWLYFCVVFFHTELSISVISTIVMC